MGALVRGRLPARVYWTRRLLLLATALGLVVAIGHLLSAGSDASSGPDRAAQAAASVAPSTTPAHARKTHRHHAPASTPWAPPVLAQPEGRCAPSDIVVAPSAETAVAGSDVTFALSLHTRTSPACTWTVSPRSLTLKVTRGGGDVWSTLRCPGAIPDDPVVVRQAQPTVVRVTWNARRSDTSCSEGTWVHAGHYGLAVAVLSGEPTDLRFTLTRPEAGTVIKTRKPEPSPTFGHD